MDTLPSEAVIGKAAVEGDELRLREAILVANASRLDEAFVQRQKLLSDRHLKNSAPRDILNISALAPLALDAELAYYADVDHGQGCRTASTRSGELHTSSRFIIATYCYCSRECQRAAREKHKRACKCLSNGDKKNSPQEDCDQVD